MIFAKRSNPVSEEFYTGCSTLPDVADSGGDGMPGDGLGGRQLEGGQGRRDGSGGVQPGRHRLICGQQARYPVVQPAQHCNAKGWLNQGCGSGMCIRIRIFPSRIRIFPSRIPDPHQRILTQKIVSKLSEIRSGLFIPDPDPGPGSPSRIPDPGVKKAPDSGVKKATGSRILIRNTGLNMYETQRLTGTLFQRRISSFPRDIFRTLLF